MSCPVQCQTNPTNVPCVTGNLYIKKNSLNIMKVMKQQNRTSVTSVGQDCHTLVPCADTDLHTLVTSPTGVRSVVVVFSRSVISNDIIQRTVNPSSLSVVCVKRNIHHFIFLRTINVKLLRSPNRLNVTSVVRVVLTTWPGATTCGNIQRTLCLFLFKKNLAHKLNTANICSINGNSYSNASACRQDQVVAK